MRTAHSLLYGGGGVSVGGGGGPCPGGYLLQ